MRHDWWSVQAGASQGGLGAVLLQKRSATKGFRLLSLSHEDLVHQNSTTERDTCQPMGDPGAEEMPLRSATIQSDYRPQATTSYVQQNRQ